MSSALFPLDNCYACASFDFVMCVFALQGNVVYFMVTPTTDAKKCGMLASTLLKCLPQPASL